MSGVQYSLHLIQRKSLLNPTQKDKWQIGPSQPKLPGRDPSSSFLELVLHLISPQKGNQKGCINSSVLNIATRFTMVLYLN